MNGSRISHPPGGRLVKVWRWAVDAVGVEAALVLGELEWRDRLEDVPCQCVATRQDFIAALEGFCSSKKVDSALQTMQSLGWVVKKSRCTMGETNIRHWHEYALQADVLSAWLSANLDVPKRESPTLPSGNVGDSRTDSETGTSTSVNSGPFSLSPHKSREKEDRDRAAALAIGRRGGLSSEEIEEVLSCCQFPSQMPQAMREAISKGKRVLEARDRSRKDQEAEKRLEEQKNAAADLIGRFVTYADGMCCRVGLIGAMGPHGIISIPQLRRDIASRRCRLDGGVG